MFGKRRFPAGMLPSSTIPRDAGGETDDTVPQTDMGLGEFEAGIPAFKLFQLVGLTESSGAARRLIKQGGGYVNGRRLSRFDEMITTEDIEEMEVLLRAGKKHFFKICIKK